MLLILSDTDKTLLWNWGENIQSQIYWRQWRFVKQNYNFITKLNTICMKKMWMEYILTPPPPTDSYLSWLPLMFHIGKISNFVTIYSKLIKCYGLTFTYICCIKRIGYEEKLQIVQVVFIHLHWKTPWCIMKYSYIYLKHTCINTILKLNKRN